MSWLLGIVLIITLLSVIAGIRKGLIRTIVSTFFLVFVMAISVWLEPYAENALIEYTGVESFVQKKCDAFVTSVAENLVSASQPDTNDIDNDSLDTNSIDNDSLDTNGIDNGTLDTSSLDTIVNAMGLPEYWTHKILSAVDVDSYKNLLADSAQTYVSAYLADAVMKILSFAMAFFIAVILISIVLRAVDMVTELPFISLANRLGGAVAGLARSILWVWIFFAILSVFASTGWGRICLEEVRNDQILKFLYTNNILLDLILKIL